MSDYIIFSSFVSPEWNLQATQWYCIMKWTHCTLARMILLLLASVNLAGYFDLRLGGALLIILIGWMIFLEPFLDVIRMPMLTVFFFTQLNCGILCLQNVILWPMTWMALGLELIGTLIFWFVFNQLSYIFFPNFFFFLMKKSFPVCCYFCLHLLLVMPCLLVPVKLCVWWITSVKTENYH